MSAGTCAATGCDKAAQPEHSPCCMSGFHKDRGLCCEHYCRFHFVEVGQCDPETHLAPTPKENP